MFIRKKIQIKKCTVYKTKMTNYAEKNVLSKNLFISCFLVRSKNILDVTSSGYFCT